MAVSYKKLWKLLIDKDMKKKDLANRDISSMMNQDPSSTVLKPNIDPPAIYQTAKTVAAV